MSSTGTKIIINADGVRKLIEHDPEGSVELARTAAAQVAQEVTNRIVKKNIEEAIGNAFRQMTVSGGGHWAAPKLTDAAKTALNEAAREAVEKALGPTGRAEMRKAVAEAVDAQWAQREAVFLRSVDQKLDGLIGARLMGLLAKAGGS